nr:unnamed protein product [Callosobruchus chinensis]
MNPLECCRLCSATTALLPMISGKSNIFRKYIQDMTIYTTGMKFDRDDSAGYICITCVVQVYNFYVFKTRSLENEKILATRCPNVKETPQDGTNNLELPAIDEIKRTFIPWLKSKFKQNAERKENKFNPKSVQTELSLLNMVNTSSQCDILVAHLRSTMAHKDTQTLNRANVKTKVSFSQTDCVQHKDTAVQTITRIRKRKHESMECSLEQKNGDQLIKNRTFNFIKSTKNGLIRSSLIDVDAKMDVPKVPSVEGIKKLSHISDIDQSCIRDEVIKSDNTVLKTKIEEWLSNAEVKVTTDKKTAFPSSKTLYIDLPSEKVSLYKPSESLEVKRDEQGDAKERTQNAELRNNLDETKVSKTLRTDMQSQSYLSPGLSGLLSISDKVEYGKVCKYCDLTLYSQNEIGSHRREHLKCRNCRQRFTGMRKLRFHFGFMCEKRLELKIDLVPLEKIPGIKKKYPCIERVLGGTRKSDSFA